MHSVVTRRIGYPRLAASNQTRGYPFLVTRFLVRAFLVAKQTIRRVTCWYGFPVPNYPNDRPYPRDTCPTHVAGVTAAKPIYSAGLDTRALPAPSGGLVWRRFGVAKQTQSVQFQTIRRVTKRAGFDGLRVHPTYY